MSEERHCPKDQTPLRRVPVIWGLVREPDKRLEEKYGGVIYAGCCITEGESAEWGWQCPKCGWEDYPGVETDGVEEGEE